MARPYASYRHLRDAARSALIGAIEVYNKPAVSYREETFVVLLVNAWELLLKALIAKNKLTVFYKKKRGEPYRTYSIADSVQRCFANRLFPANYPSKAAIANLELLITYRDNAIHFYNRRGFRPVIYSLAQTSVSNLSHLLSEVFKQDLGPELPSSLLPIGLEPPIDPVALVRKYSDRQGSGTSVVTEFMREIGQAVQELESEGLDTGPLMTVFSIHLISTKKISAADFVVGVGAADEEAEKTMLVQRLRDPNVTHPYRQGNIVDMELLVGGARVTQYQFQAVLFHYALKGNSKYHWTDSEGFLQKYSPELVNFIRNLSKEELEEAVADYRADLKRRRASTSQR